MEKFYFLLLTISAVYATHFRYGLMTWAPVRNGTFSGSYYVVLALTTSWGWRNDFSSATTCNDSVIAGGQLMGASGPVYCIGCSASIISFTDTLMYCTAYSPASYQDWSFGYRTQNLTIYPVTTNIQLYFGGSYWQDLVPIVNANWTVKARINLQPRSDNGLINTSPVTTSYPSYCIRQGFNYTIVIPMADANNDDLRCRWADTTINDECGGICGIIKSISTLTYTKGSAGYQCQLQFRGDIATYGKFIL